MAFIKNDVIEQIELKLVHLEIGQMWQRSFKNMVPNQECYSLDWGSHIITYSKEFLDESYFPYCAYPEEKESAEEIKNCPFHLRKGM